MTNMDNIFNKVQAPFIIGGDFNAHSMEWGCDNNSPRAETILDALEKYNSVFLNDGSLTRIQSPPHQSSAIDLTITDTNNSFYCCWKTVNDNCGSDHVPIITTAKINAEKRIPITSKIISKKRIQHIIQEKKWEKGMSIGDFTKSLHDIVKYAEIEVPKKNREQNKPWWNNECSKALALSFKLTKKFRHNGDRNNYDAMVNQQKTFKKITKQAKKDGWFNYCSSITRESSLSEIWKMAKIFKGSSCTVNSNEDCDEWIHDFMNKHSLPTPCNQIDFDHLAENTNEHFEKAISRQTVQRKIDNLKKSASGIDKISNNILKSLPAIAIEILTDIFNNIIETAKFLRTGK